MRFLKKTVVFVLLLCGILLILVTAASLLYNSGLWYFRALNFPRLEVLICLLLCLLLYLILQKKRNIGFYLFITCLAASLFIQAWIIYPYMPFASKAIPSAEADAINKESVFSIIVVNVLMHNRQSDSLLTIINNKQPTFLLTMEVNEWWVNKLSPLNKTYPYRIIFPAGNTYGMCLYSRLPLQNSKKYFLNHDSVPSFQAFVTLPNGASFQIFTIHPVAPKPSGHPDNVGEKEVALPKAAHLISAEGMPALAAGDFNDVGWSYNLKVFQEMSGLEDIRYGRKFYNSFKATSAFMRWPLDYIFVSKGFKVLEVERLNAFGSDHFPYYAKLCLER